MSVWVGMTGGMDKYWVEKESSRLSHQLGSCSLPFFMSKEHF